MPTNDVDLFIRSLSHVGVKGMHWGVRKNYQSLRNKTTEHATFKSTKGETVSLNEKPIGKPSAMLGSISKRFRKLVNETRLFEISVNGKNVGKVHIREKSKDVVNFAWISVSPKQRGKGYATTIFNAGIDYAKSKGYSKITLEVPGNAPDARHIYDKAGFKPTGVVLGNERDIWGGLTVMEYNIPKRSSVRHSIGIDPLEFELALEQTFNDSGADDFLWGGSMTQFSMNEKLSHVGVKGMHWGVRKANSSAPENTAVTWKPGQKLKTSGGRHLEPSIDAVGAALAKQKAKKSGTQVLSTKELQNLVTRMNLEQQYSRLAPPKKSTAAKKFISDVIVNVGKQQASKFVNDQLTKQIEKMLTK